VITLAGASIPGDGTASIAVGTDYGSNVTTSQTVATFHFHALATVTSSPVAFASTCDITADNTGGTNDFDAAGSSNGAVTLTSTDTTAPTGGSISYTNGNYTAATVALTVDDGTDETGGSGINPDSRIIQRQEATLSAGSCGTYGLWGNIATYSTINGTYPNFTDATVSSGKCYKYQYLVSDNAGNPATYTSANVAKVDTAAPSGGSITYTNGYFTSASVSLTAADGTDAASGLNTSSRIVKRQSATLANGTCGTYSPSWSDVTSSLTGSYPNFTDGTVVSGNCYQYEYLISDNFGNQATYTSTNVAKVDTVAPSGGSMTYTDGNYTTASVALTVGDGTDSVSGISAASRIIQRQEATLSAGSCGSYGSWGSITSDVTGTYPNFTDGTVVSGKCYQYKYLVSDNASNQATYTSANVAKVDTAAPSGGSITYTDGFHTSASVGLTANDGTDSVSGINTSSRIVKRRSSTLTGTTCGSYGSWSDITSSLTGSYPDFTDTTVITDHCYQYEYLVSNNVGNQATYASNNAAKVDTSAPVISGETAASIADVSTVITWTTNEAATSQVEYGTDTSYGSTTTLDSSYVTSHSQNLSGLTPNTPYHYRVISSDGVPNQSTGNDHTFTTSITMVATPVADPAGDTYSSTQSVNLSSATNGATIHYTVDGTDPSASSPVYSSAIGVSYSLTIKAIAMKSGMADSAVMSEDYIIGSSGNSSSSSSSKSTDISKPKLRIGSTKESIKNKTIYAGAHTFSFEGQSDALVRGEVKVYKNGRHYKTVSADSHGSWGAKINISNDGNYDFKLYYYDADSNDLGHSDKFTVKVDTSAPEITDLPLVFHKRVGQLVWWTAQDDQGVDHYKYELDGKINNIKKASFIMPQVGWGVHILTVTVYDKAGNETTKKVAITVW
ncbi:MAG: chitobiase/beta-hexosaminidase C-terminal domain-containing protein, partial [Candidatus Pacebacteria bacterium]|nr:chitobiase/beta-hexosaminidase C-terminal domain-containing protein [Candidatus Paceibacterota bacterium]